nr:hypothetical protein [Providencia stuartii]ELR5082923.1 hypothetical protein [Providencia stuartii]
MKKSLLCLMFVSCFATSHPFVQTVNELTESICNSSNNVKQCRSDMKRIIAYSFASGRIDLDCQIRGAEIKASGDARKIKTCEDASEFLQRLHQYDDED